MTKLAARIMMNTGFRFPKHGWFGRGTTSRELLRWIGISAIRCNVAADMLHAKLER